MAQVDVLIGCQWGDEGKGKLTDYLLSNGGYNVCARASGGRNAGHSVKIGTKSYSLHMLPSGLVTPDTDNLIGTGVVFNVEAFFKELSELESQGVPNVHERIHVSSRCHLNLNIHAAVDGLSEAELGSGSIGTTKRGIGPSYSTKASRDGLRVIDLYHESFEEKLRKLSEGYRKRYGNLLQYSVDEELEYLGSYKEKLRKYIVDAVDYMTKVRQQKRRVLVEGSQALMLDNDYGTYPYVTSSYCTVGGCIQGLSLSPFEIKNVLGVIKAYTTRVGDGPFPTEQKGEEGKKLQHIGREIGVSTGRTRRTGWYDACVARHSVAVNHYTVFNLTKLDVLDTFPTIRAAVAYLLPNGQRLTTVPADLSILENCTVEYKDFDGWQGSTKGAKKWSDLPKKAQEYIEFIETETGVKVGYIGTGPDRSDMIIRS